MRNANGERCSDGTCPSGTRRGAISIYQLLAQDCSRLRPEPRIAQTPQAVTKDVFVYASLGTWMMKAGQAGVYFIAAPFQSM